MILSSMAYSLSEKGSDPFVRSTLRAVPAKGSDPFSDKLLLFLGFEVLHHLVQTGDDIGNRAIMGAVIPDDLLLAACLPQRLGHWRRHQLIPLGCDHQKLAVLELGSAGQRID